ncbi:NAD(P)H quinone oxidoreductase [Algimonas arctica]|uniref:NAD(P)H quinone oxidoreductase n=1 Tax=Algimonas arctica TaxID=1479486 RepID=A0A8J3G0V5_9PROT|nr:NAD(P)H-quinone oxidoreductase [Algimonas arctica]GHA81258.1 NAD(P)H quinone oxidoreductase [Algimonas arctica]
MRAVTIQADKSLLIQDRARPDAGDGEILIRVEAAGVNRADLLQRAGFYPAPPGASEILGLEVVGHVEAVGPGTTRFKIGDRVCALLPGGGYADFAVADEGSVLPVPDSLSAAEACCFPEAVFTVWANVFDRARLHPGEVFLCHGGTSGIGVIAVQMARLLGAESVFATAGTDEKCALAVTLGVDRAINYKSEDFVTVMGEAGGADVILDMVGGDYVARNIQACRPDGRIINIAYMNGFKTEVDFRPVLIKRLSLMATTLRARPIAEKRRLRDALEAKVWPFIMDGTLRPVLDSSFALSNVEAAHARMQSGQHSGKIVLLMGEG